MEFNKQESYAVPRKCDVSHFIGEILVVGLRQIIQTILLQSKFRAVFREVSYLKSRIAFMSSESILYFL